MRRPAHDGLKHALKSKLCNCPGTTKRNGNVYNLFLLLAHQKFSTEATIISFAVGSKNKRMQPLSNAFLSC